MFAARAKGFQDREYQDPREVVDVLVDLSESTPGDRRLPVPVGADSKMASTPINETQAQIQAAIGSRFGFE